MWNELHYYSALHLHVYCFMFARDKPTYKARDRWVTGFGCLDQSYGNLIENIIQVQN